MLSKDSGRSFWMTWFLGYMSTDHSEISLDTKIFGATFGMGHISMTYVLNFMEQSFIEAIYVNMCKKVP